MKDEDTKRKGDTPGDDKEPADDSESDVEIEEVKASSPPKSKRRARRTGGAPSRQPAARLR
jgi:hypothetical protein